jgi:drug/metabolite transporter (DMT)-like permease
MMVFNVVRPAVSFLVVVTLSLLGQYFLRRGVVLQLTETGLTATELFRQRLASVLLSPLVVLGFSISALAGVAWLYVLAQFELSRAIPIMGGLTYLVVFVIGRLLLREQLGFVDFVGVICIVVGIALLGAKPK